MIKDWFNLLFSPGKRIARRRLLLSGKLDNREIKPHWQEAFRESDGSLKVEKCYNCGIEFSGKYCPNCGQRSGGHRLTMKLLFETILAVITNLESGFWRVFIDIFWRPGFLMRDFMRGQRKRYGNPFALLFIAITIFLLEIYIFNPEVNSKSILNLSNKETENVINPKALSNDDADMEKVFTRILNLKDAAKDNRHLSTLIEKIDNNREFSILVTIPLYGLALKWVMSRGRIRAIERRRRKKLLRNTNPAPEQNTPLQRSASLATVVSRRYCNFTESCAVALFYALQLTTISIITLPFLEKINLSSFSDSGFLISLLVMALIIGQLYHLKFWKSIWKSLLLLIVLSIIKFAIFICFFFISAFIILTFF